MAKSVARKMGLQVSYSVHPKVSQESAIRPVTETSRSYPARAVRTKRGGAARRTRHAGSCPPVLEHPTQVQCIAHSGIPEGQECSPHSPRVDEREADDRSPFLGEGILREYGRPERGCDTALYPRAREMGCWSGTIGL